jgi:hypothetical protein
MTRPIRKTHLLLWCVLGPLALALLLIALLVRPGPMSSWSGERPAQERTP